MTKTRTHDSVIIFILILLIHNSYFRNTWVGKGQKRKKRRECDNLRDDYTSLIEFTAEEKVLDREARRKCVTKQHKTNNSNVKRTVRIKTNKQQ